MGSHEVHRAESGKGKGGKKRGGLKVHKEIGGDLGSGYFSKEGLAVCYDIPISRQEFPPLLNF